MTKTGITEGSKLIAKYLGYKYVPSNDLKGFHRAGWFEVVDKEPEYKEVDVKSSKFEKGEWIELDNSKQTVDYKKLKYNFKNGWRQNEYWYYKFICRNHNELRFYNDFNWLISAIEKLEGEDLSDYHYSWVDAGSNRRNNFMNVEFNRFYDESWIVVNLELDPAMQIGKGTGEGIIKDTFKAVVESITYINNLRDGGENS